MSVAIATLHDPEFLVGPPMTERTNVLTLEVGSALGFYGSWSLFSLSHHFIVWNELHQVGLDLLPTMLS